MVRLRLHDLPLPRELLPLYGLLDIAYYLI